MEQLLTRRNLLEFLAGGAVVAGAELGFVKKPAYREITEEVLASIQKRSKLLAFSILTPDIGNPINSASINRGTIAESLLLLAFLDGGAETVDRVDHFVSHQKLAVSIITREADQPFIDINIPTHRWIACVLDNDSIKKYLSFRQIGADDKQQLKVVDRVDRILTRSLVNVIQEGKNPENYSRDYAFGRLVIPAAVMSPFILTANDIIKRAVLKPILENPKFRRRDLIKVASAYLSVNLITPFILSEFLIDNFEPSLFDRQAYFQMDRLVRSPTFEHLRGNFLILKEKDFV